MARTINHAKAVVEAWEILLRYRWRLVFPAFLVCALVLTVGFVLPRKYKGVALFERRTDMVLAEIMSRGAPRAIQDYRASLKQDIAGDPALDQLIHDLEPYFLAHPDQAPAESEQLRLHFARTILVRGEITTPELDRIAIEYVGSDPIMSQKVVNTLVQNYIDRARSTISQRLDQSAEFFSNEVASYQATIEKMEARKLQFEIDHGDLLPENPNSVENTLSRLQQQLEFARRAAESSSMRINALEKSLSDLPASESTLVIAPNPEVARLMAARTELQNRLDRYVGEFKMRDEHPDLISLREQVRIIDESLANTDSEIVREKQVTQQHPQRDQLNLELTQARTEHDSVVKLAADLENRITELNAKGPDLLPARTEYRRLTREVEQAQRQLAFWEDNLRRIEMARTADTGDRGVTLEFIRPCDTINRPISPELSQIFLAAILLSGLTGIISVVLAHRTDESFLNADQVVDTLQLPLLGGVSEIISHRQRRIRSIRRFIFYPLNTASMAAVLITLACLLYLNLHRPELYKRLTSQPAAFVQERLSSADPRE